MRAAISRRCGMTSVAKTRDAPANRQIATAISPIGPQPRTATVAVVMSSTNVAKTALPIGSWIAAISGESPSDGQALRSGRTMYSAKAPSASTPRIRRLAQTCSRPVRHW
jgi:hypothetical protein